MNIPHIPELHKQPQWQFNPRNIIYIIIAVLILIWLLSGVARASEIVSIARSEIGNGEQGENNKGAYVRKYLNEKEGLPWCAGFVSYCLKKSGYHLPYTLRAKDFLKYGKQVNNPQVGDLIVFSRKNGGHVGIIEKVHGKLTPLKKENKIKIIEKIKSLMFYPQDYVGGIPAEQIKQPDIKQIQDIASEFDWDGCPNCLLSIIVFTGIQKFPYQLDWDYKKELENVWADINSEGGENVSM